MDESQPKLGSGQVASEPGVGQSEIHGRPAGERVGRRAGRQPGLHHMRKRCSAAVCHVSYVRKDCCP